MITLLGGRTPPLMPFEAAVQRIEALIVDANRLCDRQQGGTYEDDCRRSLDNARQAVDALKALPTRIALAPWFTFAEAPNGHVDRFLRLDDVRLELRGLPAHADVLEQLLREVWGDVITRWTSMLTASLNTPSSVDVLKLMGHVNDAFRAAIARQNPEVGS